MTERSLKAGIALTLALLPVAFVCWYSLGSVIAAPAFWLARTVLQFWVPELIESVSIQDTTMMLFSSFGEEDGMILPAQSLDHQLVFQIDTRLLTYSIPFYAALHFAIPMESSFERFTRGMLALWVLAGIGLVFVGLKDLMLGLGEDVFSQAMATSPNVIAFSYQLSVLIVPSVAPIMLWAYEAGSLGLLPQSFGKASS